MSQKRVRQSLSSISTREVIPASSTSICTTLWHCTWLKITRPSGSRKHSSNIILKHNSYSPNLVRISLLEKHLNVDNFEWFLLYHHPFCPYLLDVRYRFLRSRPSLVVLFRGRPLLPLPTPR